MADEDRFERLLAVQEHDTALDQLRHRRAHLPERAELAAVEAEQARMAARRATVDGERGALASRQSALEKEVANLERRRADLDRKLAVGTIPKELETLSHEVDATRQHIHDLEDVELELMEAIEPLDTELAQLDDAGRAAAERVDLLRVDLAQAVEAVESEISREQAARAEAVGHVPVDLVERYEKMRARMGGVAVARLIGGRCSGCNLTLPTSENERIRHAPAGEFVTCEQCGRILVH